MSMWIRKGGKKYLRAKEGGEDEIWKLKGKNISKS